jgi:hypothetical protein
VLEKLGGTADFMSLDVEGYEMEALKSNDWTRLRPTLLVAEINQYSQPLLEYILSLGYVRIFMNHTNCIFYDALQKAKLDAKVLAELEAGLK